MNSRLHITVIIDNEMTCVNDICYVHHKVINYYHRHHRQVYDCLTVTILLWCTGSS